MRLTSNWWERALYTQAKLAEESAMSCITKVRPAVQLRDYAERNCFDTCETIPNKEDVAGERNHSNILDHGTLIRSRGIGQ